MAKKISAQLMNLGMDTVMTHRAYGRNAEQSLRAVQGEAIRLEQLLSRFIVNSDISRINESAGIKCESVSEDTYQILSQAVEFSKCCSGLFDVTIAPLVSLWNNYAKTCKPPEESNIRRILSLVDYTDILLDPSKKTAGLRRTGQSIDLGGIGKGYAGDKLVEVFKRYGVRSAFTNIGGNVVALGTKPDGTTWNVGIQHPRQEKSLIGTVSVADKSVVTSGDYQRFFIDDNGSKHHHILDPSTGYPARSGLVSVTIIADSSMVADALSTILFISGMEKGIELIRRFQRVEAILIDHDLQVHVTSGLDECFQASEDISVNIII